MKYIMTFGDVLKKLEEDPSLRFTRVSWQRSERPVAYVSIQMPDEQSANDAPYMYIVGADGKMPFVPGPNSLLAKDWFEVDGSPCVIYDRWGNRAAFEGTMGFGDVIERIRSDRNRQFARRSWMNKKLIAFNPSMDPLIAVYTLSYSALHDSHTPISQWMPTYDDLLADDWYEIGGSVERNKKNKADYNSVSDDPDRDKTPSTTAKRFTTDEADPEEKKIEDTADLVRSWLKKRMKDLDLHSLCVIDCTCTMDPDEEKERRTDARRKLVVALVELKEAEE